MLAGPHPHSLLLGGFAPRSGRRRSSQCAWGPTFPLGALGAPPPSGCLSRSALEAATRSRFFPAGVVFAIAFQKKLCIMVA